MPFCMTEEEAKRSLSEQHNARTKLLKQRNHYLRKAFICQMQIESLYHYPTKNIALEEIRSFLFDKRDKEPPKEEIISTATRKEVFELDSYRCQLCGRWKNLEIDHIHPRSKGGSNHIDNLQTLCRSCNSKKGVKV